jgi:hypothetical protein
MDVEYRLGRGSAWISSGPTANLSGSENGRIGLCRDILQTGFDTGLKLRLIHLIRSNYIYIYIYIYNLLIFIFFYTYYISIYSKDLVDLNIMLILFKLH